MLGKAAVNDPQVYTDLTQLKQLKSKSNLHDPKALEVVVRQFESLFVSMMLKSMREANASFGEDSYLDSDQTRFYQGMYDDQLSVSLVENHSLGLTDVLMRQLGGRLGEGMANTEQDAAQSAAAANPFRGRGQQALKAIPQTSEKEGLSAEKADAKLGQKRDIQDYDRSLRSPKIAEKARESLEQVDALVEKLALADKLVKNDSTPKGVNQSSADLKPGQTQPVADPDAPLSVQTLDPITFDSPEEFVAHLYPIAQRVGAELGVDPKVLVAQSALETGWGKHVMPRGAGSSFNLFGIKADQRWQGETTQVTTLEYRNGVPLKEKANFRAYESYEASFRDYLNFLRSNPRYEQALQQSGDSAAFVAELQQAGYATDPHYSQKIHSILRGDRLQDAVLDANSLGGVEQ